MRRSAFWLLAARKRGARPLADASRASAFDLRHMDRALELARAAAEQGEVPVGAVVYVTQTGNVIGESANSRDGEGNPAGHAEFSAIVDAARARKDWRLNDCTLVVTLEPCAMCAGLIVNARVGRVVFGARDPKAGFVGSLGNLVDDCRLNHRVCAVAGVREEECAGLLKAFFAGLRTRRRTAS